MWGPNPLLYDATAFAQPPDSWTIFWDPKYKGKISVWDDLSTVYLAAQILGFRQAGPLATLQFDGRSARRGQDKTDRTQTQHSKDLATGGELTNLFQNHEVILAMGWPLNTNDLRKLNFPIGETIPKENTTGWIDHLMITSASSHKGIGARFSRIHDRSKNAEAGHR